MPSRARLTLQASGPLIIHKMKHIHKHETRNLNSEGEPARRQRLLSTKKCEGDPARSLCKIKQNLNKYIGLRGLTCSLSALNQENREGDPARSLCEINLKNKQKTRTMRVYLLMAAAPE